MNSGMDRLTKGKYMTQSLLFAVAVAGALTFAGSAFAGDAELSPRAKAQADSLRKASGTTTTEVNLATNRPTGNAKAWNLAQSFRKVRSTGPSIDLAHGPRPTFSPKDPRYEYELRRLQEVQIAPLK